MAQIYKLNVVVEGKSNYQHIKYKPVRLSGLYSSPKKKLSQEHVIEYVKQEILNHYKESKYNDIEISVRVTSIEKLKSDFVLFDKE